MAKIIQYDLNENVRGCLRDIYSGYVNKSKEDHLEIDEVYSTKEELREIVDNYYLKVKDISAKSKLGILAELNPCFKEVGIKKGSKIIEVLKLNPLTNLLRLRERKVENEILYISLLKYAEGFKDINIIILNLLGTDRNVVKNKDYLIQILIERNQILEKTKPRPPLSFSSIDKNVRRSINNLIHLNIIMDSKTEKSLESDEIRIKTYLPDYRIALLLYLEEKEKKNQTRPPLNSIINEYDFIKYFFLTKQSCKKTLNPGLKNNTFYYQEQIGEAIKLNLNAWEISKK